jgi:HNH endonuclease
MKFIEYVSQLPNKPSRVKTKILNALWNTGNSFPRDWVKSSYLLKITNQKYFDRRIRELKDNIGCDIETSYIDGEHSYRLNSARLAKYNPRHYLSASQKRELFDSCDYSCAVCGIIIGKDNKGLEADHKIPLSRRGSHESNNWQALCNECNVAKRRACTDCDLNCNKCPWAFPDTHGIRVLIRLPADLLKNLQEKDISKVDDIEKYLISSIRQNLIE